MNRGAGEVELRHEEVDLAVQASSHWTKRFVPSDTLFCCTETLNLHADRGTRAQAPRLAQRQKYDPSHSIDEANKRGGTRRIGKVGVVAFDKQCAAGQGGF